MRIIAESAFNHNGDVDYLLELAKDTKDTGADYFTVQVMNVDDFCTKDYAKYELYKNNTLNFEEWDHVFDWCLQENLEVIPCVLDLYSLNYCYNRGMKFLKLHATDITNVPMLEFLQGKDDVRLILETQCATQLEINFALRMIGDKVECLIHGFSNYPTEIEELNLNSIDYLKGQFPDIEIGFADHSLDISTIPLMVLAKGCGYLEKHITRTRNNRNFDYQVSLYPLEFKQMVASVQHYKQALGIENKHPNKTELGYRDIMYKKYLPDGSFKRANSGADFLTSKIDGFDKSNCGVSLIARLKSKRLKRKVLTPFADTFMLDFLHKRLNTADSRIKTFLATSDLNEDKELLEIWKKNNYKAFAGDALSVIDRMLELSLQEEFGSIYRVTGDNPLTDIGLMNEMLELLIENDLDYVRVNGVPFGVSAELFSTKYLWQLYLKMDNPLVSEYLTLFVLNDSDAKKGCIDVTSEVQDLRFINLSVDYQKDLDNARQLIDAVGVNKSHDITIKDIVVNHQFLHREDENKRIKLPEGESVLLSEFIDKLGNQDYFVRKNKMIS